MELADFRRDDGGLEPVRVVRKGEKNCRIEFLTLGLTELVSRDRLQGFRSVAIPSISEHDLRQRLVPQIPMRRLYHELRRLRGGRIDQFEQVQRFLNFRHGPVGAAFLAELFLRSQLAMQRYSNSEQPFRKARPKAKATSRPARDFVYYFSEGKVEFQAGCPKFSYVDCEICPTRTPQSCSEIGKPAKASGAGGMDLLLLSNEGPPLPAVGEIKAATEMVGPTFALIQALTYAAELLSDAQWRRLGRAYPLLRNVCEQSKPRLDIVLLLQIPSAKDESPEDLKTAIQLAATLLKDEGVAAYIRSIDFLYWKLKSDHVMLSRDKCIP